MGKWGIQSKNTQGTLAKWAVGKSSVTLSYLMKGKVLPGLISKFPCCPGQFSFKDWTLLFSWSLMKALVECLGSRHWVVQVGETLNRAIIVLLLVRRWLRVKKSHWIQCLRLWGLWQIAFSITSWCCIQSFVCAFPCFFFLFCVFFCVFFSKYFCSQIAPEKQDILFGLAMWH